MIHARKKVKNAYQHTTFTDMAWELMGENKNGWEQTEAKAPKAKAETVDVFPVKEAQDKLKAAKKDKRWEDALGFATELHVHKPTDATAKEVKAMGDKLQAVKTLYNDYFADGLQYKGDANNVKALEAFKNAQSVLDCEEVRIEIAEMEGLVNPNGN